MIRPTRNESRRGENFDRATGPRRGELIAIVLAGATHVALELAVSMSVAVVCTVVILIAFSVYVVRRGAATPGLVRAWGVRLDNLRTTAVPWLVFGATAAAVLVAWGVATGAPAPTPTFWLTLVLYPLWGTAQQFALQNLIARNLEGLLARPVAVALVAAALFAASHYPELALVALTFAVGVPFVLVYRAWPNLWAAGFVHGILGSLAFHMVLRLDPTAAILRRLLGE